MHHRLAMLNLQTSFQNANEEKILFSYLLTYQFLLS